MTPILLEIYSLKLQENDCLSVMIRGKSLPNPEMTTIFLFRNDGIYVFRPENSSNYEDVFGVTVIKN